MDPLETLVRDTLKAQAEHAPPDDKLLSAVRSHGGRPRTGWIALAAAAVVVALAVTLVVVRHDRSRNERPADPRLNALRHAGTTQPNQGYHRVGFHGISVAVPADVPLLTVPCVLPVSYVLAADPHVAYSCVSGGVAPNHTKITVTLSEAPSVVATQGLSVQAGTASRRPRSGSQPVIGSRTLSRPAHLTITVTAPSRDIVRRILASVVAGPDPNGCPAALPVRLAPPLNGSSSVVPAGPTAAVRCVYATDGTVLLSTALERRQAIRLAAAIDALPAVRADRTPDGPTSHELFRFEYSNGTSDWVEGRIGASTVYSNAVHATIDRNHRVDDLLRKIGR